MDSATVQVYDQQAATMAANQRASTPEELYRLIQRFFHPGAATADIGCGSGRDVAWLNAQGFAATGYDASTGMLAEARKAFPAIDVREAHLPELAPIGDGSYDNVLCNAMLMHVRQSDLHAAVLNLARIMRASGRLLISYRGSRIEGEREADGRLFTVIVPDTLALLLVSAGLRVLTVTQQPELERPGVVWRIIIAERPAGVEER